jgi:hypothetical protein
MYIHGIYGMRFRYDLETSKFDFRDIDQMGRYVHILLTLSVI